ncbi:hypothetical protein GCM10010399_37390 [Dactylosporangium fulvum]|uniref:MAE_28990/MAE_18760 family HEPN-like nuclease n=1 Tax=Dactylosporangium fulvum TaxID=53359 RepID=A0ABY5VUW6_9ACTN|nr:MAE_28990/MAE_18760 family HEPN-like nuclease [Dactylosporangium fulvum]UWP80960.1 MAE_28990/MAE_18760 family HEPN-like nuclease [Dactylosporangium fulvum]
MKPAFLEFERLTEDLSRLLARGDAEEKLLSIKLDDIQSVEIRDSLTRFRQSAEPFAVKMSQYAMQLVLLYGAFERLIEGVLSGVVATLNEVISSTSDLPEKVRENHRRKSLDALRDEVWLARRKDPLLPVRLIENLHSCESGAGNYRLNALAYTRHGGNFRRKSIDELFRDIGIDDFLKLVVESREFGEYLAALGHDSTLLGKDLGAIDDLAERRNDIAHGSSMELLTRDEIRSYIVFFNAFGRAAYAVLRRHLARFLVQHHGNRFQGQATVHYKRVLIIELGDLPEGTLIQVGDPVAVDVSKPSGYELGRIETIRTESGDVQSIRSHQGSQVALGTNCDIPTLRHFFFINRDCPAGWLADSNASQGTPGGGMKFNNMAGIAISAGLVAFGSILGRNDGSDGK